MCVCVRVHREEKREKSSAVSCAWRELCARVQAAEGKCEEGLVGRHVRGVGTPAGTYVCVLNDGG